MGDMYSKEKRSHIMSLIRSKNTVAERIVFSYLRTKNIYFQKHYKRVQGSPDIALPRKKIAVFIDGDFWHGRELDRLVTKHGSDSFWVEKISKNVERDQRQREALMVEGWHLLQVWESDLKRKKTRGATLEAIADFLLRN